MRHVIRRAAAAIVETLEQRTLLSASAASISQIQLGGGQVELRIDAGTGNHRINVQETPQGLVVADNGVSRTISGDFQSLIIHGGSGNNSIVVDPSVNITTSIYGGPHKNLLAAGSGDDTLVCLGSKADTLVGGSGRDSFWMDSNPKEKIVNLRADEIAAGAVHRVGAFFNGTALFKRGMAHLAAAPATAGAKAERHLAEPATTDGSTYQDFSSHPLFAPAGPSPDDIYQGDIGDCYFLATLGAVAKTDPSRIRQSILDLGDGTYLVRYFRGTASVYVRVDGELPTVGGNLDYAGLGGDGSIWAAVMEKAYAVFHGPTPGYVSIDGGWMDQAFSALGASSVSLYGTSSPADLLGEIEADLAAGQAVTYATSTPADGASLLPSHAYMVDQIDVDSSGDPISLRLRNPWGIDGAGNDGANDGYVTVTAQQAFDSMLGVVSADA